MNIDNTIREVKKDFRDNKLDLKRILLQDVKKIAEKQNISEIDAFGKWIETEARRRIKIRNFVNARMVEWSKTSDCKSLKPSVQI